MITLWNFEQSNSVPSIDQPSSSEGGGGVKNCPKGDYVVCERCLKHKCSGGGPRVDRVLGLGLGFTEEWRFFLGLGLGLGQEDNSSVRLGLGQK